jgi:pyruvate dehydrogenase E1 component
MRVLPESISRWLPNPILALGTDGFGRSESRAALRDFFEVDARYIVIATLSALAREGRIGNGAVQSAIEDLRLNPEKPHPVMC